jgi:hypothetical protein
MNTMNTMRLVHSGTAALGLAVALAASAWSVRRGYKAKKG